jgi:hypothetical protein
MDLLEYQGKRLFRRQGEAAIIGAAERVVELAG